MKKSLGDLIDEEASEDRAVETTAENVSNGRAAAVGRPRSPGAGQGRAAVPGGSEKRRPVAPESAEKKRLLGPVAQDLAAGDWPEPAGPKYLQMVPKGARLREDQVLELDRIVLRLSRRRRPGAGERITMNTLLRVAADLLIDRESELEGESEEQLRDSLGGR